MDDSNNLKEIAMMNHRTVIRSLQLKKVCYMNEDRVTLFILCMSSYIQYIVQNNSSNYKIRDWI